MDAHSQTSTAMDSTRKGTGWRESLRRWRNKCRVSSSSSSKASIISTPTTRPPTNTSSTVLTTTSTPQRLSPVPCSPHSRIPATLFAPTTETFIHSPADPRNQSSKSNSSSPSATLKKAPPMSRRNTAPADYLTNLTSGAQFPSTDNEQPMGMVTTIVGAGTSSLRKKRSSRFRLSISKGRGPLLQPTLNSPSTNSFFERSSSRATQRFDKLEQVGELAVRQRADTKVGDPQALNQESGEPKKDENEKKIEGEEEERSDKVDGDQKSSVETSPRASLDGKTKIGVGRVRSIRVVEVGA